MNSYNLTLLIKPGLDEKDRRVLLDSIIKQLPKLVNEDLWGERELAYPIKKANSAFYAHLEFEANPGQIPSLDKMVKLNEDIIRYLLIKRKVKREKGKKGSKNLTS